MNQELIPRLTCPESGQELSIRDVVFSESGAIESGTLFAENPAVRYEIVGGIPRFVGKSNYADNFGLQWNSFRQIQLDSYSGVSVSGERFWRATDWLPEQLDGKWILDAGCGAGRFAEIALEAGANLVALDFSSAVDACYENLKHFPNLHVVQGDIFKLPFLNESFDLIYSLGVLQHTPDVERAFKSLPEKLKPSGQLCVDYYWKRFRTMLNAKYLVRPFVKNLPEAKVLVFVERYTPTMLKINDFLNWIPIIGSSLKRLVPVADYRGIFPFTPSQHLQISILDTFDMLAPAYDSPQTKSTAKRWFEEMGFVDIDVLHRSHLVARGTKPPSQVTTGG